MTNNQVLRVSKFVVEKIMYINWKKTKSLWIVSILIFAWFHSILLWYIPVPGKLI